jgi:hypothetical protein
VRPEARLCPTTCPIGPDCPMVKSNSAGIIIRVSGVRVPPPASKPKAPLGGASTQCRLYARVGGTWPSVATATNRYQPAQYVHLCPNPRVQRARVQRGAGPAARRGRGGRCMPRTIWPRSSRRCPPGTA